jgi:hypothetical protein
MRKVIDGKRFDTETATLLAEAQGGGYSDDFHHWQEALFRTPRGRFFLNGNGGPLSRYARSIDQNSWSGGSDLRPLSEAEARQWVETHVNGEFEDVFGEAEEA